MSATRTGVVVGAADLAEAKRRAAEVALTPVVIIQGRCLYTDAAEAFGCWLDGVAARHGLPPPPTDKDGDVCHYGLLGTGELLGWVP